MTFISRFVVVSRLNRIMHSTYNIVLFIPGFPVEVVHSALSSEWRLFPVVIKKKDHFFIGNTPELLVPLAFV